MTSNFSNTGKYKKKAALFDSNDKTHLNKFSSSNASSLGGGVGQDRFSSVSSKQKRSTSKTYTERKEVAPEKKPKMFNPEGSANHKQRRLKQLRAVEFNSSNFDSIPFTSPHPNAGEKVSDHYNMPGYEMAMSPIAAEQFLNHQMISATS